MSIFRDDHDAALARIESLEAELGRERAKDVVQENRLAKLEAELATAKAKLKETQARLAEHEPVVEPSAQPASSEPQTASSEQETASGPTAHQGPLEAWRLVVLGGFALIFLIVLIYTVTRTRRESPSSGVSPETVPPPVTVATPGPGEMFMPDAISALMPEIMKRGQDMLPGGKLVALRGKGITSEGTLHETYGELDAVFHREETPKEPEVDPNVPIGAAPRVEPSILDKHRCAYVKRTAAGWQEHPLGTDGMCFDPAVMMGPVSSIEPSCSMKAIWARAIADGVPPNAIADISIDGHGWKFRIDDQRLQFRSTYNDDCRR